jgi:hypothetical protein
MSSRLSRKRPVTSPMPWNEAQDAAEELGEVLEEAKQDVDDALDEAEGKLKD